MPSSCNSWSAPGEGAAAACGEGPGNRQVALAAGEAAVQLSVGEVLAVLAAGAALAYFFGAMRVRELALQAVRRASREDDFQLLDQSVHIQRVSLSRDDTGRWHIWRQYRFDYSWDGVERRQGAVIMLGRQLRALVVAEPGRVLH